MLKYILPLALFVFSKAVNGQAPGPSFECFASSKNLHVRLTDKDIVLRNSLGEKTYELSNASIESRSGDVTGLGWYFVAEQAGVILDFNFATDTFKVASAFTPTECQISTSSFAARNTLDDAVLAFLKAHPQNTIVNGKHFWNREGTREVFMSPNFPLGTKGYLAVQNTDARTNVRSKLKLWENLGNNQIKVEGCEKPILLSHNATALLDSSSCLESKSYFSHDFKARMFAELHWEPTLGFYAYAHWQPQVDEHIVDSCQDLSTSTSEEFQCGTPGRQEATMHFIFNETKKSATYTSWDGKKTELVCRTPNPRHNKIHLKCIEDLEF